MSVIQIDVLTGEVTTRELTPEEIAALPAVEPDPAPSLSPPQWSYFLDLTGFRVTVEAALSALPKGTLEQRATWAGMKAVVYSSQSYRLDITLQLAAQVRAMGIAKVPADVEIEAAWPMAAAFKGAESLIGT